MEQNQFKLGLKYGFRMALLAVRNVDKQIKIPETDSYGEVPWQNATENTIYYAQKDLLYKIYKEIKKQREIEINEAI